MNHDRSLAQPLGRNAYLGLHLTVGLVLLTAAVWIFGALLDGLLDALLDNAMMVKVDIATDAFIHAHMTPSLLRPALVTTQLGGPIAMTSLAIVGAIVLWRAKRNVLLVGWIAVFAGGALVEQVLGGCARVVGRVHYRCQHRPISSGDVVTTRVTISARTVDPRSTDEWSRAR